MTDVAAGTESKSTTAAAPAPVPGASLLARLIGVIFSPRDAYTAVAARPRALGAMLVAGLIIGSAQGVFMSSEVGQSALYDQQMSVVKALGVTVTPQMEQQLQAGVTRAKYTTPIGSVVFIPIFVAIMAGLLMAIFTAILGGGATFKQVYAVVAHSAIINAVTTLFSVPIWYLRGDMSSPGRLSVFLPMLPETSFFTYLLSAIDLLIIWALINVSIGVAVLYKRKTGSVASVLLGIYAVIALIIATVRAF